MADYFFSGEPFMPMPELILTIHDRPALVLFPIVSDATFLMGDSLQSQKILSSWRQMPSEPSFMIRLENALQA